MSKQSHQRRMAAKTEAKRDVQWADYPDLFDAVTNALEAIEEDGVYLVNAYNDEDGYGERGYIDITTPAERFRLALSKIS